MLNMALVMSFLLIMLEAFQFTYRFGIVNRAFYSISPRVIELGVNWPGFLNEQEAPYYDFDRLESSLLIFLEDRLFPDLDEFKLMIYYYEPETGMLCTAYCQGVVIKINVPLLKWYEYEEHLSFEIHKNL